MFSVVESRVKPFRWLFAVIGIGGGALLLFFLLRVVFGLWLYSFVSGWATTRLGFDYYVAELFTTVITAIAALLLPSVAAFVLFGRRRIVGMGTIIGSAAIVCLLVYTVGRDVCFDRQTGKPLCYYANTPSGRVFSFTPGFHPAIGTEFKLFTREVAEAEEIERRRQAELERERQETERRKQAAEFNRRQLEHQQQEQRQRADERREQQRREVEAGRQERARQLREESVRLAAERAQRQRELELKQEQERTRQAEKTSQQRRETEAQLAQEAEARRRDDEYARRQEIARQQRDEAARREARREQQEREEEINRQAEARRTRKLERDRMIWGTINRAIERIPRRRY